MNKSTFAYFLLVATLFLHACKSKQNAAAESRPTTSNTTTLNEKERLERDYLFFEAEREKIIGNQANAASKFAAVIRIDPRSAAAHYELGQIKLQNSQIPEALYHAEQATKYSPENVWYQLLLATILEQQRKFDQSSKIYERLSKLEPTNVEYRLAWADVLARSEQYDKAINVLNQVEALIGINETISIEKKNIFLRMNKVDKASLELQNLAKAFPYELSYKHILADFYLTNNQSDLALKTLLDIEKMDSTDAQLHFSYAEYYRQMGDIDKSFKELKKAMANPNADADNKVKVLLSYYNLTEIKKDLLDQAFELCQAFISANQQDAKAHAVYGDFLFREKKWEAARESFSKALHEDKSRFAIWNQLLVIDSELNDMNSMYNTSKEAIDLFPYQPTLYLFLGSAAYRLKKYDESVDALNQGASLSVGNPPLSTQLYSSLGDAYHAIDKHEESDRAYEKALNFDPNNIYVLNNYAYYLTLRKEKLDKAKEMAYKTIIQEPENSSFLDTYAWVLFNRNEFQEANQFIDRALANGGMKSATILEHKGDILYKLGKPTDALDFWIRAQQVGGGSDKLIKKIAEKKLVD